MTPTDTEALRGVLRARVRGDVFVDPADRALYATDASNYRRVPLAVVAPRDVEDTVAAVAACREFGVALTPRGAGTSVAGNACGAGVVLDTRRYVNRVLNIDPDTRSARIEPGVVLDDLQAAAARFGLRFGPDPSTHSRCTLGGMIGNNACGSHSVVYGTTADNVVDLDVLLYDGTRLTVGQHGWAGLDALASVGGRRGEIHTALREFTTRHMALLRRRFPALPRRVSGYGLDHLLPERGVHVARSLVGSEGTCAVVLGATVDLVPLPAARVLLVLGYPDTPTAADAVPAILPHRPATVEGIDQHLVDSASGRRLVTLPSGAAWLLVELDGATAAEAVDRARALSADLSAPVSLVTDPAEQRAFWRIREEGAGTATRLADGTEAWPGWEDAAVPPERLGGYLRGFDSLMKRHRHRGVVYGHFGEGCVHVRIDFDLFSGQGVARFRDFVTEAADLVLAHGGSLSGEHGDGRARAELLTRMYGDQGVGAFGEFKSIWDPDGRMNPGVIVRPDRIDENLRLLSVVREGKPRTAFSYPDDHDDFGQAIRRCVGVGKCVEHAPADVMCPSYAVTGEERHSTRGRAHLLFEMLRGEVVTGGWRSAEVRDALDLCLSCKGCRSDCPTGVDMATYKAEFLANHYAGRPRPATHYSLGWLPLWSRLASAAPGLVNAAGRTSAVSTVIKLLAGIAPQRRLPQYARTPFTRLRRPAVRGRPPVVLWPDTFNNYFTPEVAVAATRVLEHAGFDVLVPRGALCCGLTWISTGQLGVAARVLRRTLRILRPVLEADVAVVGLEPSCVSVFRSDLAELLPDEAIARRLARQTRTLPEFLQEYAPDWSPPRLSRRTITQTHCHQYAVLGSSADEAVLAKAGLDNQSLPAGCCGLAGDFGFQRGHYDIARAIGERTLLPAVRAAEPDTLVVADGFSCRTQIVQETDRAALHLAQVLAMAIGCP